MRTRILLVLLACIATKLAAGPPFAIPRSEHLVVDGETGDWEDGLFTSVSLFTDEFGYMPDNQDLEPSLKMAWSKKGLILVVEVTDDHVSEPVSEGDIFGGDCLEIFVCDDVGGKNLMQYIISPFGEEVIWDHRGKRALQTYPGKIHFVSRIIDRGYTIEAFIPFTQTGVIPKVNQTLGFQLNVIDVDSGKEKPKQSVRWFYAAQSYDNSLALHSLILSSDEATRVDHNIRSYFEGDSLKVKVLKRRKGPFGVRITSTGRELLYAGSVENGSEISLPISYSGELGEMEVYDGEELLGTIIPAFISSIDIDMYPLEQSIRILNYREKLYPSPEHPIVLVGHSMFRYWHTVEDDLKGFPVVNKAFGGSQSSHVNHFYKVLIKPLSPALIIYFEGANDIRTGKSHQEVACETEKFIHRVSEDYPATRIALVSHQLNRYTTETVHYVAAVDSLHYQLSLQYPKVDYIDATLCLIGEDNQPYEDIYLPDNRHLNQQGYIHLSKPIRAYLEINTN